MKSWILQWLSSLNWTWIVSQSLVVLSVLGGTIKLFLPKYIEQRVGHGLDLRVAAIKNGYERELTRLRSDLEHLADRGVRSNEREYQTLADAWEAYLVVHIATSAAVINMISYPNLALMKADEIAEYLEEQKVHVSYKRAILAASEKERNHLLVKHLQGRQIDEASKAMDIAQSTIRRGSVFMPLNLYKQFEDGLTLIRRAYAERKVGFESSRGGPLPTEGIHQLVGGVGDENLEALRVAVRGRLLRDLPARAG